MKQNRRNFLKNTAILTGSALFSADKTRSMPFVTTNPLHAAGPVEVFINQYMVSTFYEREGINYLKNLDRCFAELKAAGLAGVEVMAGQPEELNPFIEAHQKQNMQVRSIYVNGNLHDEATAMAEIKRITAVAEKAKTVGAKVVVYNPMAKSGKSDAELNTQNQSLDLLGAELRKTGLKLAMHYHTTELEFAGREFHSFMCDTKPENVSLCFDTHWSYRASNNSAVSAYSHAKLYGDRIVELHVRQSQGGIWTETFVKNADIDYDKTLAILRQNKGFDNCLVVLEQAPEKGTPKTLQPIDIFKQSVVAVKQLFSV